MDISKKTYSLLGKILLVIIIIGCSEILAQSDGVKSVIIMVGEQGPDGCESLGKIKGSSNEGESTNDNTPYIDRLTKARNNLRNEAQKLGGNTIHIIHSNTTGNYEIPGANKEIIYIGNAYRCE